MPGCRGGSVPALVTVGIRLPLITDKSRRNKRSKSITLTLNLWPPLRATTAEARFIDSLEKFTVGQWKVYVYAPLS